MADGGFWEVAGRGPAGEIFIFRCGWGVGPCCAPGGHQYGWEPAGSPAGPGRNLAVRVGGLLLPYHTLDQVL